MEHNPAKLGVRVAKVQFATMHSLKPTQDEFFSYQLAINESLTDFTPIWLHEKTHNPPQ